jgi:hypothetical protein
MAEPDPTLAFFEYLIGAWATGAAEPDVQESLERIAGQTVDKLDVALLLDATHKGPSAIRKDGALRTALAKGPTSVAVRLLERMANTTGWEAPAAPVACNYRRRVQLHLPRRHDEAEALGIWEAAAPFLVDGRLRLWDGPWDTVCLTLAKGWLDLAQRIQDVFPVAPSESEARRWFRWSDTIRSMRKHPVKVQRKGLDILRQAVRACHTIPDGHSQVRGMGLGDLALGLRLQPTWASGVHAALQGMPEPKPGKAQEQDMAWLAALLASAHGRLAVAGWAWDPALLLGSDTEADRVARKLLGFPSPKEQRLARKRARQVDRGRKPLVQDTTERR